GAWTVPSQRAGTPSAYRLMVDAAGKTFGGADGRNPWDDNYPGGPFEVVVHSGPDNSLSLIDNRKNWRTNDYWVGQGYQFVNISKTNALAHGAPLRSTSNSVTFVPPYQLPAGISRLTWNKGDTGLVYRVNRVLDQAGAPHGYPLTGGRPPSVI